MATGNIVTKKNKRKSIKHSDPGKLLDLVINLNDDTSAACQIKINDYLMEECESEIVFMIIVFDERMEASIDAVGIHVLPRKNKIEMTEKMVEMHKSVTDHPEFLSDFGEDFQEIVTPYLPKTTFKKKFIVMTIPGQPFSVILCLDSPKVQEDIVPCIVQECFSFVWPTLKKTIAYEYECTLKQKCQQLLRVAKRLFTQVASLDTLLQITVEQAKSLVKAEYCLVKLVDFERMELTDKIHKDDQEDYRYPMDVGIVGEVLKTGALINCKRAQDHPSFNAAVDVPPGVRCKTLLCFPIREQTGIIGVGQLINKIGDPYFDSMDEEMALSFSIYCGVCIMHSVFFRKIQEAHIRNTLTNELIMYHMKVGDAEVSKLLECTGFHNHPHVTGLYFNLRALPYKELPCYVYKFFGDLGLDRKFKLNRNKLARFILHVKQGYRAVPYHNWRHAFNVVQWAYAALCNFRLVQNGYFNELQALMYLIACLTHDLDHRGTTNSFQIQGQTTLAALYSSEGSVMERHHLAQAVCILNTDGCDVLDGLTRRDYDRAILMLRDFILATDLANYFKNKEQYLAIGRDFQKANKLHNMALQAMLMSAADLSDNLKDWDCVKKTAAAVLTEFFRQGDVEKKRGELPITFMDRTKCVIPELEVQFLSGTCIPLYATLAKIIPKAAPCQKVLEGHIEKWIASKPVFQEVPNIDGLSVLLSPELDALIEMSIKEGKEDKPDKEDAEPPSNASNQAQD